MVNSSTAKIVWYKSMRITCVYAHLLRSTVYHSPGF